MLHLILCHFCMVTINFRSLLSILDDFAAQQLLVIVSKTELIYQKGLIAVPNGFNIALNHSAMF